MSRKGNCRDNAVAESFFSSLKKERIKKQMYKNRELAIADVAEYIDAFYNRTRRHSHLDGVSPEQFESAHKAAPTESPLNPGNSTSYFETLTALGSLINERQSLVELLSHLKPEVMTPIFSPFRLKSLPPIV